MVIFIYYIMFLMMLLIFPQTKKLIQSAFVDLSRSLYTSLVHKPYSIAQVIFIIAKLSSFILKKPYNFFPATTNIPDDRNEALP